MNNIDVHISSNDLSCLFQISEEQKQILERELNEIKERLRLTESQLVEERNSRNSVGAKVGTSEIESLFLHC